MNIKKDINIWKFCFYGFFKNLRFFEPFLYIFFIKNGLSFLQIGSLISIREIVRNVLEVPSGIFADEYGRIRSLKLCFTLYIISFMIFYIGFSFPIMALAMAIFGVAEAFRSGTHKAIIFSYLDYHHQTDQKVEVYSRTKSFSLLGSSLSALIGGVIVFVQSNYRLIFLLSIIPYVMDYLLVNSYPDFLEGEVRKGLKFKDLWIAAKGNFINLRDVVYLRKGLINSCIFEGYYSVLKDYLQPILKYQILGLSFFGAWVTGEKGLAVLLGVAYCVINLITSITTRNAYKLKAFFSDSIQVLNVIFLLTVLNIGLIGFLINRNTLLLIIIFYLSFYILRNLRRPFMLDYIGTVVDKKQRASMLSIEAQLQTFITIVLAPILGFAADQWGIWVMFELSFATLGVFYLLTNLSSSSVTQGAG